MENGQCQKCEMYIGDRCLRAEKMFSSMTDPVCLQKVSVMLLRDMAMSLQDMAYDE